MKADLHVHSTASDGTCTPSELVDLAMSAGLSHLALSDHDSTEGIAEATSAAARTNLTLIPAVELSAVTPDGRDVHVLGYWIDPSDDGLRTHLSDLRAARLRRARTMVVKLAEAGFDVDLSQVLAYSNGGAVGRSHVARALVAAGHVESVQQAFQRLIGHGRPYYVAKDARTPLMAVQAILDAGGLPVIAHPGINQLDDVVRELAGSGLAGVEAYHADHTAQQREHYSALARSLGLLVTGGSDFHGPSSPNPHLGSVDIPEAAIEAFLAAGAAR